MKWRLILTASIVLLVLIFIKNTDGLQYTEGFGWASKLADKAKSAASKASSVASSAASKASSVAATVKPYASNIATKAAPYATTALDKLASATNKINSNKVLSSSITGVAKGLKTAENLGLLRRY
jgi:hypothetical protein